MSPLYVEGAWASDPRALLSGGVVASLLHDEQAQAPVRVALADRNAQATTSRERAHSEDSDRRRGQRGTSPADPSVRERCVLAR